MGVTDLVPQYIEHMFALRNQRGSEALHRDLPAEGLQVPDGMAISGVVSELHELIA